MHRFYLPPDQCHQGELTLSEAESHHARDVLRLRPGERVTVLDGAGHELHCRLNEAGRGGVTLTVLQRNFIPPSTYRLTLLQAIPKGKAMETIVQKATELGAWRIVPLLSERSVVQLAEDKLASKSEKLLSTALEAMKQCGAPWLPRVETPQTPKDFLAGAGKFDLSLVASLQNDRRHPREYFRAYMAERGKPPNDIWVWVGPEGDFTPAELSAIKSAGALPMSLGPLILRSETAAIYCLAILNYELQSAGP